MFSLLTARFMISFGIMNLCMALGASIGKTQDEKSGWLILAMLLISVASLLDDLKKRKRRNIYHEMSFSRFFLEGTFSMYLLGMFTAFALFLIVLSKFTVIAIGTSLLLFAAAAYLRLSKASTLHASELAD